YSTSIPRPPSATLFPYTTLFRSIGGRRLGVATLVGKLEALQAIEVHIGAGGERVAELDGEIKRPVRVAIGIGALHQEEMRIGHRSEEHTSELQSRENLVGRLLLE